jgi:hypothetical protein
MKPKKLTPKQMESLEGGIDKGLAACISFGISFVSMFTGPWGILGLAGMMLTAGDCEDYLGLSAGSTDNISIIDPRSPLNSQLP